jgi:hypothetical protein
MALASMAFGVGAISCLVAGCRPEAVPCKGTEGADLETVG